MLLLVPVLMTIGIVMAFRQLASSRQAELPDVLGAYEARAQVVGLRYVNPARGLVSSREGYWEVHMALDGTLFRMSLPPEGVVAMREGLEIPVVAVPCRDRTLGLCDLMFAGPFPEFGR